MSTICTDLFIYFFFLVLAMEKNPIVTSLIRRDTVNASNSSNHLSVPAEQGFNNYQLLFRFKHLHDGIFIHQISIALIINPI